MKLNEVLEFQNGFAFKSKDFISDGSHKIIKIKELKDGEVKFFEDSASINYDKKMENYLVNKGDVLFALTGDPVSKPNPLSWVGRTSIYLHESPALLNQRVCKVIPSEKVNSKFIYYYFRNFETFYSLASIAKGSASQANISTKDIGNLEVDFPQIDIQNKIVDILESIDNKITTNRVINNNLAA